MFAWTTVLIGQVAQRGRKTFSKLIATLQYLFMRHIIVYVETPIICFVRKSTKCWMFGKGKTESE